jgi:hypothetical protein
MSQEKEYFWSKNLKDARKKTALDMLKGMALITGASSSLALTTVFSACFPENADFLIPLYLHLPLFVPSLLLLQLYSGSLYRSSGDPSEGDLPDRRIRTKSKISYLLLRYFNQLTVVTVNFEGQDGAVGPLLTQMAQETNAQSMRPHLGFAIREASSYPNGVEGVKQDVGLSNYWGAVVVYPNCTSTWTSSLQTGNTSYDPTGCIGVFYSGARFYQITLLYLAPFMAQFAGAVAKMASNQALSNFLTNNAGNAATLATAANVPQALATPFSFYNEDVGSCSRQDLWPAGTDIIFFSITLQVRPIKDNEWAVAAPFEAGLIYYLLIAFQIAVWGNAARQKTGWNKKLHYHWLVTFRLAIPMIDYIWVSLMFSLLFKAFQIPTDAAFGNGKSHVLLEADLQLIWLSIVGGFFALWSLNYLAICAVGLALEVMVSVLGGEVSVLIAP